MADTINTPNIDTSKPEGRAELDILNADDKPGEVGDFESDEKPDEESDEKPDEEEDEKEDEDESGEDSDEDDEEDSDSERDESDSEDESDDDESRDLSLYKSVKKDFPELFKKHPELKTIIFREQRYTSIYPSVEEAEEAKGRNEAFSKLEEDILEGNPKELFKAIEETDKNSLTLLAHNILPVLLEQNKELYSEVIAIPVKRAIQQAYIQAKKAGNKNLMNSALYLDDFFFEGDGISNDPKLSSAPKKSKDKDPEVQRLEKERDEHAERIRSEFNDSVIESLRFKLGREITAALTQYEFDSYKRKNVARDIENEVNNILANDVRYQAGVKSLYSQASSAKFTSDWKARIISAYLARAKAVLPLAKKKVIEEATGRKAKPEEKKRLVPTNLSTQSNRQVTAKEIDRSKTSDRDVLDGRITLKGK
jgi:hypothetical protein